VAVVGDQSKRGDPGIERSKVLLEPIMGRHGVVVHLRPRPAAKDGPWRGRQWSRVNADARQLFCRSEQETCWREEGP